MSDLKRRSLIFFTIGLISLLFFSLDLGRAPSPIFDEQRYVSAAKAIDTNNTNENWSHPIFAKKIIEEFIKYFGDEAWGWRIGSVVSGALTVVLISALAYLWSGSLFAAILSAVITIFDQALFVQSRLANLDSYMIVFMFAAILLSAWLIKIKPKLSLKTYGLFGTVGIFWGLANGCKWAAAIPAIFWFILLGVTYKKNFLKPIILLSFCLVGSYFVSQSSLLNMWHPGYAPSVKGDYLVDPEKPSGQIYHAQDLLKLQTRMFIAQEAFSRTTHPYQSYWYEWPFSNEPIVYYFQGNSAVVFLMNPVVLLFGLFSLGFCLYEAAKKKSEEALFISIAFLSLWLSWAFIPRQTQFTYYFLPAYLIYSVAIVYALRNFKKIKKLPAQKKSIVLGACICLIGLSEFYYWDILTGKPTDKAKIERIIDFKNKESSFR